MKYRLTMNTDNRDALEDMFEQMAVILSKKGGTSSANKAAQKVIDDITEVVEQ